MIFLIYITSFILGMIGMKIGLSIVGKNGLGFISGVAVSSVLAFAYIVLLIKIGLVR